MQYNVQVPQLTYEEYRKVAEGFANQVENLGYQVVASMPAVKKINGMEQPSGVTVAELLALAKMANLNNRAICLGPSPNGQELVIVSVLKRPAVPSVLRTDGAHRVWDNPIAD